MGHVHKILIGVALWTFLSLFAMASPVMADEAVTVREAHRAVHRAQRAVERAKAELREARYVESATKTYCSQYGTNVGRWVWLVNDVGWSRGDWGNLFYIISRESGGNPTATNASSGASGLLQFMPPWFQGQWGYPAFNPYNPRLNLKAGKWLHGRSGWSPWAI